MPLREISDAEAEELRLPQAIFRARKRFDWGTAVSKTYHRLSDAKRWGSSLQSQNDILVGHVVWFEEVEG
jgi:hypothetical protein